jgi:riboflavin kinase/FMN adenylyltransferase
MEKINSHLDLSHLCIGHDFALGRNREGDIAKLRELGGKLDYEVEVVLPIKYEGEVISSSKIRADLANGDINHANKLLGRPYQLSGEVVAGDGRGKTIGIPTANLAVWEERAIPKAGVYVSRANVNGVNWAAITNVGYRPTFEKQISTRMVETHILNFDSDIYGQEVRLEFITYLREEQRFDSVDALVEQIRYDISQVGEYLD